MYYTADEEEGEAVDIPPRIKHHYLPLRPRLRGSDSLTAKLRPGRQRPKFRRLHYQDAGYIKSLALPSREIK